MSMSPPYATTLLLIGCVLFAILLYQPFPVPQKPDRMCSLRITVSPYPVIAATTRLWRCKTITFSLRQNKRLNFEAGDPCRVRGKKGQFTHVGGGDALFYNRFGKPSLFNGRVVSWSSPFQIGAAGETASRVAITCF